MATCEADALAGYREIVMPISLERLARSDPACPTLRLGFYTATVRNEGAPRARNAASLATSSSARATFIQAFDIRSNSSRSSSCFVSRAHRAQSRVYPRSALPRWLVLFYEFS
jgi:hypothetical protein